MITLVDVLHRIGINAKGKRGACYDFNVCITSDIKACESDFTMKYGEGSIYYFPLDSYHHGRKLAAAFYQHLNGRISDSSVHIHSNLLTKDQLYFFVHVKAVDAELV